ncbi:uncharacterized protein EDB91DRAFT_1270733, partial [Suillus paluster]|uniref:uncharacterized protein n=1 Tax=Suillus paluster TaxID=48578 RepID=UPI001B863834
MSTTSCCVVVSLLCVVRVDVIHRVDHVMLCRCVVAVCCARRCHSSCRPRHAVLLCVHSRPLFSLLFTVLCSSPWRLLLHFTALLVFKMEADIRSTEKITGDTTDSLSHQKWATENLCILFISLPMMTYNLFLMAHAPFQHQKNSPPGNYS